MTLVHLFLPRNRYVGSKIIHLAPLYLPLRYTVEIVALKNTIKRSGGELFPKQEQQRDYPESPALVGLAGIPVGIIQET